MGQSELERNGVVSWVQRALKSEAGAFEMEDLSAVVPSVSSSFLVSSSIGISSCVCFLLDKAAFFFAFHVNLDMTWLHRDISPDVNLSLNYISWVIVRTICHNKDISSVELGS